MSEKGSSEVDTSHSNNPLSRKLNKILETRLDNDKDVLEALKAMSSFFSENNLRTRRNLRGDIERRSLTINEEFSEAFRAVKVQLDSIDEDVSAMSTCCNDMTQRLKAARDQTSDLISKTTELQKESQRLEMRAKVADAFLGKYQLKPEELKVLRGTRDGRLHEDFFKALARVKQIHQDCKILLRTNQQTAGLEIMESMALHMETTYERLYRWTQGESRSMTTDSVEVTSFLAKAMEALQDRPVLFQYSLDEYGTARRTAVVRGFIDALTRGGPGGTPRPIELHSHDPLRYTGDMLAWLHQTTASEKELLQSLLKLATQKDREEEIQSILGHITEGVCRPFKVRVEQVIVAEPGPVVLYKLNNLIKFYHYTIALLLDSESSLLLTLEEMQEFSQKVFFNALNVHATRLIEKVELPPADLSPPTSLSQTLTLLQEVLASHDSSVVPIDARQTDFARVLSCILDPLLQMCAVSASRLNTADMATYMINCIYAIQTTLALYEFTDQRLEMLDAQIEAHTDALVNEQASYTLSKVNLVQIYSIAQQHQPNEGPLSSVHGMEAASIKHAMSKFDSYLASPDSLIMPQCNLLQGRSLREKVHKKSVTLICSAYDLIHRAVIDPSNGYSDTASMVVRTPDQVRTLLS
ncbi:conserved oligomeric Golgi complex subunit 6-like [Anneissia japonica]|uniref:conserved oligomeric Golgi complex subunit 6-like n=1 Tax=Anneissia japonica TaxID=1529436 RepID=UPI0014259F66|nr:conserved oligomeric Golgi complex subunit 6-like [Anneissia japonica]